MNPRVSVYIAVSLDNFIARDDGSLDWLADVQDAGGDDYGYAEFMDTIDAVVSGRFRLVVAGHTAQLGPGDWVEIPRGRRHTATVMGNETVVSLDAVRLETTSECPGNELR